jgi:hypothetical protein
MLGDINMDFKKFLTRKVEEYENKLNIDKEIIHIKKEMEKNFELRRYTIELWKILKGTIALGKYNVGKAAFFVPYGIDPEKYRQVFVKKFKELGFTDSDIELSTFSDDNFIIYEIKLKW